ncbi:MAG: helix-turn-helix transcriptional regulator [Candidatus Eremiobacteraeota bacterium]|nr:helix-turn-helix transcriptional regulator [Candidatus Eremiobacteraeota bacterium]MBV8369204.1 helix-turn-helix transcriptional regulator [Candidatus Eremiobacteraeota bacterium]
MASDDPIQFQPVLLILISLADKPKHGYAIMQDVRSLTGWEMRPGTLYGALGRMDRSGWIEEAQTADYRRRPYALTAAGRQELRHQLEVLETLTREAAKRVKSRPLRRRA